MLESEFLALEPREQEEPEFIVCGLCPEDDNEWPESCFTMAGWGRTKGGARICNDCWRGRYGSCSYQPCGGCGRSVRNKTGFCRECRWEKERDAVLAANGLRIAALKAKGVIE